jgi:hypothetical protein
MSQSIPTNDQVRYLLDRIEIQDVIARYAIGQDAHQSDDGLLDQWHDVFTSDATVDYSAGGFEGGTYVELARWMRGGGIDDGARDGVMHDFTGWQHMLGLPTVIIGGDTATARTDLLATHRGGPLGEAKWYLNDACTFHDALLRTENGWRITHRRLEVHWLDKFPVMPSATTS